MHTYNHIYDYVHTYGYIRMYTCIRCTYVSYDTYLRAVNAFVLESIQLHSSKANLNTPITSHSRHDVHVCLNVCMCPPCGNPARSRLPMVQIFATETTLSSTWRRRRAAAAQLNQRLPRRPKHRCKATQRWRKGYTKPLQSSCKDCSAIGKT